jgi:hypothetical protein
MAIMAPQFLKRRNIPAIPCLSLYIPIYPYISLSIPAYVQRFQSLGLIAGLHGQQEDDSPIPLGHGVPSLSARAVSSHVDAVVSLQPHGRG